MINLKEHEKVVLSRVGHGAYGKEFRTILEKMRDQICSLDGLKPGEDHNAAVEGRLLFKELANEMLRHMGFEKRKHAPRGEGELGEADYT